jgi:hypothetical protein
MKPEDYEKVKREVKSVVMKYLIEKRIDHTDGTAVLMAAPGIWKALVASGKCPKGFNYEMLVRGITIAYSENDRNN